MPTRLRRAQKEVKARAKRGESDLPEDAASVEGPDGATSISWAAEGEDFSLPVDTTATDAALAASLVDSRWQQNSGSGSDEGALQGGAFLLIYPQAKHGVAFGGLDC